jgi:hypothetical protein
VEAEAMLEQLWHCHQHNPVSHLEHVLDVRETEIVYPHSQQSIQADSAAPEELVRAGPLCRRRNRSFTFEGILYRRDPRGAIGSDKFRGILGDMSLTMIDHPGTFDYHLTNGFQRTL